MSETENENVENAEQTPPVEEAAAETPAAEETSPEETPAVAETPAAEETSPDVVAEETPAAEETSPEAPTAEPAPDVPAEAAEEPPATVAAINDPRSALPEPLECRRLGSAPLARAKLAGEPPEERPVCRPGSLEAPGPGVGRLVTQRVLALGRREVAGNGDPVRRTVDDFASGELSPGKPDAGRMEAEARGQPVVEIL